MGTVLVAAYYFPPYADVSGVRATKFSKYLPQNGWHPIVYTVDSKYYGAKVLKELPREVQELDVRRIRYLAIIWSTLLVKLFYPIYICGAAFRHRKHIDAVYFCGSPFHPFAATSIITGLYGLPSVLDFRDSWSINEGFDSQVSDSRKHSWSSPAERLFKRTLERIGIRYASKVVFATGVLQKEYEEVFPSFRSKFTTITNGFDYDDFVDLHPEKATNSPLTIALTGKFLEYTPAAARYFLESLSNFPNLSFLYVGGECKEVARLASKLGVSKQVVALEFMPYGRVLKLIKGADYGLVTNGLVNGMGTKLFDYMALRKPTICLVPKGSVISREFGNHPSIVICEAPHTGIRVREAMEQLLKTPVPRDTSNTVEYSRANLTQQLAAVLEDISRSVPKESLGSSAER